jgi:hypothetical protein
VSVREAMRTRLWVWMRETGAGLILIPPVLVIIQLQWLGGLTDRGRFVYSPNVLLAAGTMPLVSMIWVMVGQYNTRMLHSAHELRVPVVLRTLWLTLTGFAVCTIFGVLVPIAVLHGPCLQWLVYTFDAICVGVIVALFTNSYFTLPVWFFGMAAEFGASFDSSPDSSKWFVALAVALPILITWRLRVLIRALGGDAHDELFSRSLAAVDGWNFQASSRSVTRMSSGSSASLRHRDVARFSAVAARICLGPLYEHNASVMLLCFASIPIMLLHATRAYTVAFAKLVTIPVWIGLPFLLATIGVAFLQARVRRLAELLYDPSGEIADLAFLPGLGCRRQLRRALLREVLVRSLVQYGLCLGGIVGSCWALLRLGQAEIEPLLFLVVPALALLLLFAMMSVGVLSGRVGRDSAWLDRSILFLLPPTLLSVFTGKGSLAVHDWASTASMWLSAVWTIVLCTMGACLVWWGIQLSRRIDLLRG